MHACAMDVVLDVLHGALVKYMGGTVLLVLGSLVAPSPFLFSLVLHPLCQSTILHYTSSNTNYVDFITLLLI